MLELLGLSGALVVVTGWLVTILLTGFVPLMLWSAARSLKGIRRELEKLNEQHDGAEFYTRTGSLNIR